MAYSVPAQPSPGQTGQTAMAYSVHAQQSAVPVMDRRASFGQEQAPVGGYLRQQLASEVHNPGMPPLHPGRAPAITLGATEASMPPGTLVAMPYLRSQMPESSQMPANVINTRQTYAPNQAQMAHLQSLGVDGSQPMGCSTSPGQHFTRVGHSNSEMQPSPGPQHTSVQGLHRNVSPVQ